jgi:hypothetical protein
MGVNLEENLKKELLDIYRILDESLSLFLMVERHKMSSFERDSLEKIQSQIREKIKALQN